MGKNLIVSRGLIKHNGVFYEAGDVIEGVSPQDEMRAELLECGQVYEAEPVDDPGGDGSGAGGPGGDGSSTGSPGGDDSGAGSPGGDGSGASVPGGDGSSTGSPGGDGSGAGGPGGDGSGTGGPGGDGSGAGGPGEDGSDAGGPGGDGSGAGGEPPIAAAKVQKMSKDDLVKLAIASNVDLSSCTNNEQRAAAIIAALGLK